jgi:hypothetical protein
MNVEVVAQIPGGRNGDPLKFDKFAVGVCPTNLKTQVASWWRESGWI